MDPFLMIFIIGVFLAVIMIFFSFAGDIDLFAGDLDVDTDIDLDLDMDTDLDTDFDTDIDGSDHSVGISYISPGVLAFLCMGIGAGGTFLQDSTDLDFPFVIAGSLVIGIITMVVMRKIYRRLFVDMQVNSTIREKDFVGATGLVSLRIPKGDIGEVTVSTRLGYLKMPARADSYIPHGAKIKVLEKIADTLFVEAIEKMSVPDEEVKEEKMAESSKNQETRAEDKSLDNEVSKKEEESEFTFQAYRKKEEAKKPTIIYDQRHITIKDSVITRSDFSELGGNGEQHESPGSYKESMKDTLKKEAFKEDKD